MIDKDDKIIVAENTEAANIFSLLRFSQYLPFDWLISFRQIFKTYGFDKVESKKDFESKLDRAITGLEIEVMEKRRAV
jgi:hypothetical protein